ncbi:hypothetical protein U1Q18_013346 [Sarracenia purpurea var. burkii]
METCKAEGSSLRATVEGIQRRLVRPPSLHSLSSISSARDRSNIMSCDSSQFEVNSTDFQKKREVKRREMRKKRLEDYLDPDLLSAVRARISGKQKRGGDQNKLMKELAFEWPVDELKWRSSEGVVDLGDGVDVIRSGGDEDDDSGTPFQRFERTALKRFKGVNDKQGWGEG